MKAFQLEDFMSKPNEPIKTARTKFNFSVFSQFSLFSICIFGKLKLIGSIPIQKILNQTKTHQYILNINVA